MSLLQKRIPFALLIALNEEPLSVLPSLSTMDT